MKKLVLKKQSDMPEAANSLLDGLNEAQREAAATTEGPVLILAGAGSGKTRVLTYRIAHLLEKKVPPQNILALTFTNKAAREMKERIEHLTSAEQARRLWMGTFHSIFARILRIEGQHLGFTSSYSIFDTDDSLGLIREIMKAMGVVATDLKPQGVRAAISTAKNSMITWQEMERSGNAYQQRVAQVFAQYEKRLHAQNAMDFDDIILNMIRLFALRPDVLAKYHDIFRYILIDEFQDTNKPQFQVVTLLAQKYRNICAVGDDAQSIYGWRGADISNILGFGGEHYKDCKVVRLTQNYRSTKTILEAANSVISNNKKQLKKELWTANDDGEPIRIVRCYDEREEAATIVDMIEAMQATHTYSDCAVLYRTNAQSQPLEEAFRRKNVPYTIVGGISFFKRKEVKDVVAYLRLLVNPADDTSLARIINVPTRGIGDKTIESLREEAGRSGCSILEYIERAIEGDLLPKRGKKSISAFMQTLWEYRDMLRAGEPLTAIVQAYIEATGLVAMYEAEGGQEGFDRWNNVQQVFVQVRYYEARAAEEGRKPTLDDFLQEVSLFTDADEEKGEENSVTLMTMHSAKGLEFPFVAIAGMEQGLFPMGNHWKLTAEDEEEERRLCYVGITRAKEKLVITHADRRFRFGTIEFGEPSQFIKEIPSRLTAGGVRGAASLSEPKKVKKLSDVFGTKKPEPTANPYADELPPDDYSQLPTSPAQAPKKAKKLSDVFPKKAEPSSLDDLKRSIGAISPVVSPPTLPPSKEKPAPAPPLQQQPPALDTKLPDAKAFKAGILISHETFGRGRVVSVSGVGDMKKATIAFEKAGRKDIILKFGIKKMKIIG